MRKNQTQSILEDLIHRRIFVQEAEVVFLGPELFHLALDSVKYVITQERKRKSLSLTGSLSSLSSAAKQACAKASLMSLLVEEEDNYTDLEEESDVSEI